MPRPNLRSLRDDRPLLPADNRSQDLAGDRADLEFLCLCGLQRPVAQDHVAQLVRHDAGHFIVGARRLQHAAVEEHRAARQREGVDLSQVDDVERVSERRLLEVVPARHRRAGGRSVRRARRSADRSASAAALRTSAAACRPSWTSCDGLKLFLRSSMLVCAERLAPARRTAMTEAELRRIGLFRVMRGSYASLDPAAIREFVCTLRPGCTLRVTHGTVFRWRVPAESRVGRFDSHCVGASTMAFAAAVPPAAPLLENNVRAQTVQPCAVAHHHVHDVCGIGQPLPSGGHTLGRWKTRCSTFRVSSRRIHPPLQSDGGNGIDPVAYRGGVQ